MRGATPPGTGSRPSRLLVLAAALALVLHPFVAAFGAGTAPARDDLVPVCTGGGLIWVEADGAPPLLPRPPARPGGLHLCCFLNGQVAALTPPAPAVPLLHRISRRLPLPRDAVPAGPPPLDTASARGPPATV